MADLFSMNMRRTLDNLEGLVPDTLEPARTPRMGALMGESRMTPPTIPKPYFGGLLGTGGAGPNLGLARTLFSVAGAIGGEDQPVGRVGMVLAENIRRKSLTDYMKATGALPEGEKLPVGATVEDMQGVAATLAQQEQIELAKGAARRDAARLRIEQKDQQLDERKFGQSIKEMQAQIDALSSQNAYREAQSLALVGKARDPETNDIIDIPGFNKPDFMAVQPEGFTGFLMVNKSDPSDTTYFTGDMLKAMGLPETPVPPDGDFPDYGELADIVKDVRSTFMEDNLAKFKDVLMQGTNINAQAMAILEKQPKFLYGMVKTDVQQAYGQRMLDRAWSVVDNMYSAAGEERLTGYKNVVGDLMGWEDMLPTLAEAVQAGDDVWTAASGHPMNVKIEVGGKVYVNQLRRTSRGTFETFDDEKQVWVPLKTK